MIVKTRRLPPTQGDPARMRATSDGGAVLTIPYPYGTGDPNEAVALALARAYAAPECGPYSVSRIGDNQWEINLYVRP